MRIYDQINAPAPKDIDQKRAHIIGGGIAGLSAAIALVNDAHMPAVEIIAHPGDVVRVDMNDEQIISQGVQPFPDTAQNLQSK